LSYGRSKKVPYLPQVVPGDIKLFRKGQFNAPRLSAAQFPGFWPLHGYTPSKRLFRLGPYILHAWDGSHTSHGKKFKSRGNYLNHGLPPMPGDGALFAYYIITELYPDRIIPESPDPVWVSVRHVHTRDEVAGSFYGVRFHTQEDQHAFASGTRTVPVFGLGAGVASNRSSIIFGPTKKFYERIPGYEVPTPESPVPRRIAPDADGGKSG